MVLPPAAALSWLSLAGGVQLHVEHRCCNSWAAASASHCSNTSLKNMENAQNISMPHSPYLVN